MPMPDNKNHMNLADHLKNRAEKMPNKNAVLFPAGRDNNSDINYTVMTFEQLDRESDIIASGLEKSGIKKGTKTILMIRPGPDFFIVTFALVKTGAIPVMVDPGMGIKRMLNCFKESHPKAFIGIPKAHILRTLFPGFFKSINIWITAGRRWCWGGYTLKHLRHMSYDSYTPAVTEKDETAAIMFTTGSTGPAKGVIYTHGTFDAQVHRIKSHFNITEDEIDLPTFPLFAIFDPALGITAVIPEMDPTKPALVNPENIIQPIKQHHITNMFGSPALLNRVGSYAAKNSIKLPSLKRVVSAGAPVLPENIKRFASLLNSDAEIHTPYGATESFPIVSIGSKEILEEAEKKEQTYSGTCVGYPLDNIRIRIIKIIDEPIETWSDDLAVPSGDIGEITVDGDVVTKQYDNLPKADALAKIRENDRIWHRMGDLGWMDEKGRVWFCGRKNHRVTTDQGTLFTIPCEAVFNQHPAVFRSALVGIGNEQVQTPVICVEPEKNISISKKKIEKELLALAEKEEITRSIKSVLFHKSFPVDIRHNSKIFREKLAKWAEKQLS